MNIKMKLPAPVLTTPYLPIELLRVLVPQEEHIRLGEHHQFQGCS